MSKINYTQVGYHYNGPLEFIDRTVDVSTLGPHDVLVKIAAAALNPVDLLLYNTAHFVKFFTRSDGGFGRDFAGVVESTGSAVTKFQVGDKISGIFEPLFTQQGSVTEYLIVDTQKSHNIGTIPNNLTLEQAAAFPLTFGTAYTTLTHFKKPAECENVLVLGGATSVGAFTIQLLKKVHKVKNVVTVNSANSAERAKRYGSDIMIDYKKGNVKAQAIELAKDIGKFDLIIDCVGGNDMLGCMSEVLKPKSTGSGYVSINGATVGDYRSSALQFFTWDNVKLFFFPKKWNFKMSSIQEGTWYEYGKGLFEEGLLEIPIDSVHKYANYQDAINTLLDHKAQGKVVITMASS